MSEMLDQVAAALDTQFADLTIGTNLWIGQLLNSPTKAVGLYEYGGDVPTFTMGSIEAPVLEGPRLQVMNRDEGFVAARTLAKSIWAFLMQTNTTIGGTPYLRISPVDTAHLLERDKTDRVIFVCNYEIVKVP
jgi:hypothetical protein